MFIRATREVDWVLHLAAFRAMIPWFFVCDKYTMRDMAQPIGWR